MSVVVKELLQCVQFFVGSQWLHGRAILCMCTIYTIRLSLNIQVKKVNQTTHSHPRLKRRVFIPNLLWETFKGTYILSVLGVGVLGSVNGIRNTNTTFAQKVACELITTLKADRHNHYEAPHLMLLAYTYTEFNHVVTLITTHVQLQIGKTLH